MNLTRFSKRSNDDPSDKEPPVLLTVRIGDVSYCFLPVA
jgi:hypothetical protein